MDRRNCVVILTPKELGALREAVRLAQQMHAENSPSGRALEPTLSKIQRKLGEEPNA